VDRRDRQGELISRWDRGEVDRFQWMPPFPPIITCGTRASFPVVYCMSCHSYRAHR
jgi:hypothetical protein